MESMKDFEKEINESLDNMKQYNDPDASKWEKFEEDRQNKVVHQVKITEIVKAGAVAHLNEVRAFIPASQLSSRFVEDLNEYLGKSLEVVIITADEANKRLVLSHRELEDKEKKENLARKMANIHVGDILEGKVESLKDYGAFINLEEGVTGLLHVSQIAHTRIKHPAVVLKEGQEVRVKVIGMEKGRISLSKKALEPQAGEFAKGKEEEVFDYKESGVASTSLAGLLSKIKLPE